MEMEMETALAAMLRAAWIAATLPVLVAFVPSSRFDWFRQCVLGFAKRGKIMQSGSNRFTVPQKYFCHFYALSVVWTTFLLAVIWLYAYKMAPAFTVPVQYSDIVSYLTGGSHVFSSDNSSSVAMRRSRYMVWQSVLLLLLMEIQVLRRLIETIYTFNYSPSARMHILGYFTGIFFYTAVPLSLCCTHIPEALIFFLNQMAESVAHGQNKNLAREVDWLGFVSPLMNLKWYSWIGMAIFLWGWIHQRRCHAILGSLRENHEQASSYVIPHGDWFNYVSSPHYLAEIVIYAGFVVASGGTDITIWLLFVFVVGNLALAAAETQRWYHQKFDNYPRSRFAIIPFVY